MAFYDKDKIKEALTIEDIAEIGEYLDAEPELTSFGVILRTVCHNGKGNGSDKLYYYDNTKLFNCYTGCGSMDIFELIERVNSIESGEEMSFYELMSFVVNFYSLDGVQGNRESLKTDVNDEKIFEEYERLRQGMNELKIEYDIYSDDILNNLSYIPPAPWLEEGISNGVMKKYGIKYYGTEHKVVIPHYNVQGDLIGIRGRAMIKEDAEKFGKYMPLEVSGTMYSHPLSHNLYGLNFNLENINKIEKLIVYEGEKSVMLHESLFGSENNIAVATCGNTLSLLQEAIIRKFCEVEEIIIAYDKEFKDIGDSDFHKSVDKLKRIGTRLQNSFRVSTLFDKDNKLEEKDAPIDKGREVFEHLYENRIFIGGM